MREPETLLHRPEEVAALLQLSRSKTYELIAEGQIPSIRIGRTIRVSASALEHWIREQEGKR